MNERPRENDPLAALSKRERVIAERFAEGLTHREIGEALFIAPSTVRTHIAAIYRKLKIGNKAALIRLCADGQNSHGETDGEIVLAVETELAVAQSASRQSIIAGQRGEVGRRQLTVLAGELHGLFHPTQETDPEELREVIMSCDHACRDIVARFEGFTAGISGGFVQALFGYPTAHEDDAERAVRAGLALIEAVARTGAQLDRPLQLGVGIATGQVVEDIHPERQVIGASPHLAARLQVAADPGTLLVAASTRSLLGRRFELEALSRQDLTFHRVLREVPLGSRFEARSGPALPPMVGRDHELELLLDRWHQVLSDGSQVVLLIGEPGIGKSRLVQALLQRLADGDFELLRYQCTAYFANTPLHPILEQLERAAELRSDDVASTKLAKLEARLGKDGHDAVRLVPLLADLLSIPIGGKYPPLASTPPERREMLLQSLVDSVVGRAQSRSVLVNVEDVHWIDPTSLEFLDRLVRAADRARLLFLITFRPEFTPPPWIGSGTTVLTLGRLSQAEGRAMVDHLITGRSLPDEILTQIVERANGVPLFIEELTKALAESDLLRAEVDDRALAGPPASRMIPATLQDSLMARLDRLGPAKDIAQICAVIGRTFSLDMLAAITSLPEEQLRAELTQLTSAALIFRDGGTSDASYSFKHTLIQDTAYQSLIKSRRQQLHAQIAAVLERRLLDTVEPELLAHHYTAAGLNEQAIACWYKAGQMALGRFAHTEVAAHLNRGLELVELLRDSGERAMREIELCVALGPVLMHIKGSAASEVGVLYERVQGLCRQVRRRDLAFPVLWGLWCHYHLSDRLSVAAKLADELIAVAEDLPDTVFRLQGHHSAWVTRSTLGEFALAQWHIERGLRLYDPDRHASSGFTYGGHDAGVCGYSAGAVNNWILGYPDRALHSAREGVALARCLGHPFSTAEALFHKAILHQFRREPDLVAEDTDRLLAHCAEHDLETMALNGQILQGWLLLVEGEFEEGIARVRQALDTRRGTRTSRQVYYLAVLAEALGSAGEQQRGSEIVAEALNLSSKSENHRWEALLHQVGGQLALTGARKDVVVAEEALRRAIAVARQQETKSLELRAATSLAQLQAEQGKRREAHDLLSTIYGWFTEGFDTADLKDAKALLDELA